jgi:hypothetical protein
MKWTIICGGQRKQPIHSPLWPNPIQLCSFRFPSLVTLDSLGLYLFILAILAHLAQGYIVRFGQCSVFLIPINKRRRWKLVLSLTDGALYCS